MDVTKSSGGYRADQHETSARSVRIEADSPQSGRNDELRSSSMSQQSTKSSRSATSSTSEGAKRGPSIRCLDNKETPGAMSFSSQAFIRQNVNVKVSSRYQVDEKAFASGGNGNVFLGRDRTMADRQVVIKKIVCHDEEKITLFKREVEIMKTLKHPNVCKIFETYEDGRSVFIVMEVCDGGELFDQIADRGHITEPVAADIIGQVASALNYAHGMGIAHRDLKPENVCLASQDPSDNTVKVIDWGLGFFFGGALRMKSRVGSLAYAAPEVLQAEEATSYTETCDLWSLGAMAYVMLCGRPPFWGGIAKQLNKMMAESYPMHAAPWDTISADAKDFIKCLLKRDPGARLPIKSVVDHPWLRTARRNSRAGDEVTESILWNMQSFRNNSEFLKVCMGAAAAQLDSRSLKGIQDVFSRLDTNSDGSIDMWELQNGFEQIYGAESEEAKNVVSTFRSLDMDGSGKIDYDEFIAVALGEKMLEQETCLWAAFKAFDVYGDDSKVTKEEIEMVLKRGDVRQTWSEEVCDEVAGEILKMFDQDKRGYLDFDSWLRMMRTAAWPDQGSASNSDALALLETAAPPPGSEAAGAAGRPRPPAHRPLVAWVSLDPRTAEIHPYPAEVSKLIEASYQRREDHVFLGEAFRSARVCFVGSKNGLPFQRTQNGLRDVRRLPVGPETTELELRVSGVAGEYRFSDDGPILRRTFGIVAAALDPEAVASQQVAKGPSSGTPWSFDAVAQTVESTLPQSLSAVRRLMWGAPGC